MQGQEIARAASFDHCQVELPVVAFPILFLAIVAREHLLFHEVEFVVRGDEVAFPIRVAVRDRETESMALEQHAQVRDFYQIFSRYRGDEETPLILGVYKALAGESVEGLAERRHAGGIALAQSVQLQFRAGSEVPEDDVSLDLLVGRCADNVA